MSNDISQMMADAAESAPRKMPSNEEMVEVAMLASKMDKLESTHRDSFVLEVLSCEPTIPELEEALRRQKEQLAKIKEYELPTMIEAFGLSEFTLIDGSKVTVKEDVYAGITEDHKSEAFAWLKSTGNDGIIKNEFKVPFGKGQDTEAQTLQATLDSMGFSYANSKSVHPQTLKAFVRRRLESGEPVPVEIFSVHIKKIAQVKFKK